MSEQELPALAEEREREAIDKAHAVFKAARELVSTGMLMPIGYRVMVKVVEAIKTLEVAQAEEFPTLAERQFESKSENERNRQERGEQHGVMIAMGKVAFNRLGGRENWCDVGDVVTFPRNIGQTVEHPPGSNSFYQIFNDEDCFGRIE